MDFSRRPVAPVYAGQEVNLRFELEYGEQEEREYQFQILDNEGVRVPFADHDEEGIVTHMMEKDKAFKPTVRFDDPGDYEVQFKHSYYQEPTTGKGKEKKQEGDEWTLLDTISVEPANANVLKVALQTGSVPASNHAVLWDFISGVTRNLTFKKFDQFAQDYAASAAVYSPYGSLTYDALHELSAEFVTETARGNTPVTPTDTSSRSPRPGAFRPTEPGIARWNPGPHTADAVERSYVTGQVPPDPVSFPFYEYPLDRVPFVELIYVYWLEEAMLFQTLNRILARFQNRRSPGGRDALSRLAVSPLLPLRGLLWGLAESEKDRLSLRRRAAEYEYQYGLQLIGRAIPPAELLVERRTQFLEAFHSLLNASHKFYREDSDKTVDADAFPLLSNLRELHLVLAHGANNQFADASVTARIETIEVQWMLAQPEMHDFLGGRTMIPYDEKWMERVDTMKSIQGWSDTSVTHFYDLAVHGEQLLLSVRHGQWNSSGPSGVNEDDAKNWAKAWKESVQRYIHAYRAVTGVDLSERVDTTMPSTLLQRRLARKLVRY